MRDLLVQKLTDIIREGLTKDESVKIEGLGTFSKKHEPSREKVFPGGKVMLMPPRDIVEFKREGES